MRPPAPGEAPGTARLHNSPFHQISFQSDERARRQMSGNIERHSLQRHGLPLRAAFAHGRRGLSKAASAAATRQRTASPRVLINCAQKVSALSMPEQQALQQSLQLVTRHFAQEQMPPNTELLQTHSSAEIHERSWSLLPTQKPK